MYIIYNIIFLDQNQDIRGLKIKIHELEETVQYLVQSSIRIQGQAMMQKKD